MTRQRLYQLRQREKSLCERCPNPAVKYGLCLKCWKKRVVTHREMMRRRVGAKRRNTKALSYSLPEGKL